MSIPQSPYRFILHFARKQWPQFTFLVATSVVWAVSDAFFPYFLKRIVNTIESYHGPRAGVYAALAGILTVLALFWLVSEVLLRAQGMVQVYTFPRFRATIRAAVFKYVTAHSHDYFSNHFAGSLAKKLADLPTSCQTVMETICYQFITATVGALLVLVMMWHVHAVFAWILLVWMSMHMGLAFLMLRHSKERWEVHSDSAAVLSGKIVDAFTNILNMRLFARARYESEYLARFQTDELIKAKRAMWLVETVRIGFGINGLLLLAAMIFTLIRGWVAGWVTLGDFTQVSMQSFWLLGWMWFVSYQLTVYAREMGTIADALRLVQHHHDVVDPPHAPSIQVQSGTIDVVDVVFGYHDKSRVFDHLSLHIPAGQKVGLVGFSGSGKTTFVNLLLRFYDVQAGAILLDGQNIATVTQDSLRAQIAMIPQDPTLFHRSLMENIRYGRLDASDAEVITAAKLAHCHEFITTLDEGYHALVGERGVKLSGGQRQRIAIARAMLKNAPLLILDEATSALDSVTEKLIQHSLHTLMCGKTTIVIAHRLSTLADMDRILVFDHGRIIEDGTKDALLAKPGHFARLWEMQVNGFLPEAG